MEMYSIVKITTKDIPSAIKTRKLKKAEWHSRMGKIRKITVYKACRR
jgi:hypothetical protein